MALQMKYFVRNPLNSLPTSITNYPFMYDTDKFLDYLKVCCGIFSPNDYSNYRYYYFNITFGSPFSLFLLPERLDLMCLV